MPPTVTFLGFALAKATTSFTVWNFESPLTMSMYSSKAKLAIGVKSL